jgi:hypothetical protein
MSASDRKDGTGLPHTILGILKTLELCLLVSWYNSRTKLSGLATVLE